MGLLSDLGDRIKDKAEEIAGAAKDAIDELTGGGKPTPQPVPVHTPESERNECTAIGGTLKEKTLADFSF